MKLRCTTDHIRLRLRKSDIAMLRDSGSISIEVHLGTSIFAYSLTLSDSLDLSVDLEDGHIMIRLPKEQFTQWADSNKVGIEKTIVHPDSSTLGILVEKDFPCLDRENEDKSDTFFELVDDADEAC